MSNSSAPHTLSDTSGFSGREAEKIFFIGLLVFWLLLACIYSLSSEDSFSAKFSQVSLLGMILGSIFSLTNFRSWRLLALSFLSTELEAEEAPRSKALCLLQALALKTLAILLCVLLIARGSSQDILGFLLSFSAYLFLGIFLLLLIFFTKSRNRGFAEIRE